MLPKVFEINSQAASIAAAIMTFLTNFIVFCI